MSGLYAQEMPYDPRQKFYPQELPATPGELARARVQNLLSPNTTRFTPAQSKTASRMFRQNNPLGLLGEHVGNWLGLKKIAQQLGQTFDPRSTSGLVNDATMLLPGGAGDASGPLNEMMPGQFEPYSMPKAQASGQIKFGEGQPTHTQDFIRYANNSPTGRARLNASQLVHDDLFGGEVHATGDIPPRPEQPPANSPQVSPADRRVSDALSQGEQNHLNDERLKAVGLPRFDPQSMLGHLVGYKNSPTEAGPNVRGEGSNLVTPREVHNDPTILNRMTGGHPLEANAVRTAALKRLLAMRMHNHQN